MSLFFDSQNKLRSGWKLSTFIAVFMPVLIATNFLLKLLYELAFGPGDLLDDIALNVLISFIPAVIATVFLARIVEMVPLRTFGIGLHQGWARHFGIGTGVGIGLIVLLLLGSIALGAIHMEWTSSQSDFRQAAIALGMLIVAAAREELLFRGYPLQVLMKGLGNWPAMISMSCVFGLLHAQNPNSSRLGVFNTIVAGVMLSLAYFKTRSLWLPFGLHLCWNVATGMVLGFPLSGLSVPSLWTTRVTGAEWLLGGEYGPEGGLLGTIIFVAGIIAVWKLPIERIHYDNRLHQDAGAG